MSMPVLPQLHGVDWDMLAKEIPSKEKTQIKNYYQNYKQRLELDQIELPPNAKHPKPSRTPSRASTPRPGTYPSSLSMLGDVCVCYAARCLICESLSACVTWHAVGSFQMRPFDPANSITLAFSLQPS